MVVVVVEVVVPFRVSCRVVSTNMVRAVVAGNILGKVAKDSLLAVGIFAEGPTDLQGSAGEDLAEGVEVFVVLKEAGKESVHLVVVVPGSEHVDDSPGQFVEGSGVNPGSFNAVESS